MQTSSNSFGAFRSVKFWLKPCLITNSCNELIPTGISLSRSSAHALSAHLRCVRIVSRKPVSSHAFTLDLAHDLLIQKIPRRQACVRLQPQCFEIGKGK